MRDHLLGLPANAHTVAEVLADDWPYTEAYPLGVPARVRAAMNTPPAAWIAQHRPERAAFEYGNHPNPDGSCTPMPPALRVMAVGWAAGGRLTVTVETREKVVEGAAAALGMGFKARTAKEAADRIGEAFAHIAAATPKGERA